MKEIQMIQKEVYHGRLSADLLDVLDWLMSRENIMPRLNRWDDNDDDFDIDDENFDNYPQQRRPAG